MLVQLHCRIIVTKILYYSYLLLDSFRFCGRYFTTHPRFVPNKSAISPFLGGIHGHEACVMYVEDIHVHTHTCTYAYMYEDTHVCGGYTCIYSYMYIHIHMRHASWSCMKRIYMYILIHVHTHTWGYPHEDILVYPHTCTYTYTYIFHIHEHEACRI